jgi:hypothetical protein
LDHFSYKSLQNSSKSGFSGQKISNANKTLRTPLKQGRLSVTGYFWKFKPKIHSELSPLLPLFSVDKDR